MNREQKRALTILISMSVVIMLAVVAVTMKMLHLRWLGILLLLFVAAAACVGGIVYFRLRPKEGRVVFDERDREIQRNANLAGFGMAYFLLGLGSFVPSLILGGEATISVAWLPLMVAAAMACHAYAFFVSILVQYGRGTRDE
jgi:hypothetical protein